MSAQDGCGVAALKPVVAELFEAQLAVLPWQTAGAVRVGALPTRNSVLAVAAALQVARMASSRRRPGLRRPAEAESSAMPERARRCATSSATLRSVILTPNLAEAAFLLKRGPIERERVGRGSRAAARARSAAVLLTGGHLVGDPADALACSEGVETFSEPRIAGAMHGTGCTLAMALACELAAGRPLNGRGSRSARLRTRRDRKTLRTARNI